MSEAGLSHGQRHAVFQQRRLGDARDVDGGVAGRRARLDLTGYVAERLFEHRAAVRPIGIPETEIRNKQWWAWDGTNVTNAYLNVYAVPGKTGWVVDDVNADYNGQYVPALALQGFGNATFYFNFPGVYQHTLEANTIVYGTGYCDAEFFIYGTVPGDGSYVTCDIHIE